ncbi:hypothetical protein [Streptomyces echinatus]
MANSRVLTTACRERVAEQTAVVVAADELLGRAGALDHSKKE